MNNAERKLYENRITVFIKRIKEMFYENDIPIKATCCKFDPPVTFENRLNGEYRPISIGDSWGSHWQQAWFHLTGKIPKEWAGKTVAAKINLGGESLIFSKDGVPVQSLSVHSLWANEDFERNRYLICENARGGDEFEIWIEATAGQLFGLELQNDVGDIVPKTFGKYKATVKEISFGIFRKDIWHLYLDCFVLNNQMTALPEKSVRRARINHALNKAIDCFLGDKKTTALAGKLLKPELAKKSSASDLQTTAVGHAHLDTAWLWPISETIRKCARTFSSQIDLLEKYPDYIFGASQPQQYDFVKRNYPRLYQKIKQKIAEKRWEPQGGMWVEADCNLISGESLVRQILLGKKYFQDEFDVEVKNLWLPDVFGYSAALPQILKKSGINYFVTQKLSWNQFNKLPNHTFVWRGIDGSEVITHFPPEDNYNSDLRPSGLIYAQENFKEKPFLDEFLTLFGIGDGGGGATEEIIETGLRQCDLEGCPKIKFGFAQDFLDRLREKKKILPIWAGELYFELHRGTLTTQAYNKKMNRFLELKLRETEILWSLIPLEKYPAEQLDKIWKKLLLHQFHDIIPGSSITPVYDECRKDYEELKEQVENLKKKAGNLLFEKNENHLCLVNTLSTHYSRPIELPENWFKSEIVDQFGNVVTVQMEENKPVALIDLPPLSAITLAYSDKRLALEKVVSNENYVLENEFIRYEFEKDGSIKRIYDKECQKEVLEAGKVGNLLRLYEDRPNAWDAWDIDIFYENQLIENANLKYRKWICNGPVRQGIYQKLSIGNSTIEQKIYLAANSKRLDFETEVDWRENHKMLRVSFTAAVYSETAAYEIQYGHIKRNTHRNTSWDKAKFEVAGHRFVDLSDKQYGAALLNDCKYGHKIFENVIDLNLLRATTMPDPKADRGRHQFTYSLLPHKSELIDSGVFSEAAQLNQPPAQFVGFNGGEFYFPFKLETDDVILEVVKKAEKENATILRFYEPKGKEAKANLKLDLKNIEIFETDLMEKNLSKMKLNKNNLELHFKPFEIKTVKIHLPESS